MIGVRPRADETTPGSERHRTALAWGFADQGFSSASNLGLSLLAGRLLGPAGLGTVFIGFSVYLVVTALQRHLIVEPLVAGSSGEDAANRRRTASLGLTMILIAAIVASIAVAIVGALVRGPIGDGLLLVAPWLGAGMVQDYWRHLLFRDRRSAQAAVNDGGWCLAMLVAVPAAVVLDSGWAVMGVWGFGALTGALVGLLQFRLGPAPMRTAWRWWRRDVWPFGRWNAGAGVVMNLTSQATVFVISAIVGASALGGLRAAESVFAPLTLIVPAIALPGLPAVSRAHARDPVEGRRLGLRLSGLALAGAIAYIVFMAAGGWRFLPILFGSEFERYRTLIWPLAAGQVFFAIGIGFQLIIKAQQRGRVLLLNRIVAGVIALAMITTLGVAFGIDGAAWGSAAGSLTSTVVLSSAVLRFGRSGSGS
jgi:O-antigen/teichoic acid export membrane protein